MSAALIVSALVGFNVSAPLTLTGALSFLQFTGKSAQNIIRLQQKLDTPALRIWAARNGEGAIHMQPGISSEK